MGALFVLLQPVSLLAQSYDARLDAYGAKMTLGDTSPMMTWLMWVPMLGACVGVMFYKTPKPKEED